MAKVTDKVIDKKAREVALQIEQLMAVVDFKYNRHQLNTGLTLGQLLGIRGSLYHEKNDEAETFTEEVEKGWIENYGFKKQHIDLQLGYYYLLSKRLSIGGELHYTFGSLLQKNFNAPSEYYYKESQPLFIDFGLKVKL